MQLLLFVSALISAAPAAASPTALKSCTASSFEQLERCEKQVFGPNPLALTIEGTIQCPAGSPQDTNRGCLDLRRSSHPGVPAVPSLWISGGDPGARLFRSNYTRPILSVGGSAPLSITGLTLEDASWLPDAPHGASCFPRLAPSYPTQAMVNVHGASSVAFRNMSFVRGFHIAVSIVDSHSVVFSDNLWVSLPLTVCQTHSTI
jgi:hypothetical protein